MSSAQFRVGIGGLRELRRDLRRLDAALPAQVIPRALRASAELVEPPARTMAPVGTTGRLQRSHRVLASQRRAAVAAGSAEVFYGKMVFYGTGQRVQRTTGRRTGMVAPNPWLLRALAAVGEHRIVDVFDRELTPELRRHGLGAS